MQSILRMKRLVMRKRATVKVNTIDLLIVMATPWRQFRFKETFYISIQNSMCVFENTSDEDAVLDQ